MSEKYILAIDIGGTFIKYAYVNQLFTIQEQWKKETKHFDSNDEFYDYLCEGIQVDNINCVGISAPGLIDYTSLVKTRAAKTVENMYGTTVNEEVGKRLNRFTATINDAKSAGLCELKIGNAQGTRSSGYLIIGTGVGGCLCNDKDVITTAIKSQCFNSRNPEYISTFYVEKGRILFHCVFVNNA